MKRKLLSILLVLAMALTLLPVSALAEEMGENGIAQFAAGELQTKINDDTTGTVTLDKSYTEDITIPAGKSITLDLGGNTLTNTNAGKATLSVAGTATVKNGTIIGGTSYYNIEVLAGGSLTLEGVTATAGNSGSSMIDNHGTLMVTSGTYTGGLNVLKNEATGAATINGGTFTLTTTESVTKPDEPLGSKNVAVLFNYGSLTVTNGKFVQGATDMKSGVKANVISNESSSSAAKISGGTFTNESGDIFNKGSKVDYSTFTITDGKFNRSVPFGYLGSGSGRATAKQDDGWYHIVKGITKLVLNNGVRDVVLPDMQVGETFQLKITELQPTDADVEKGITWTFPSNLSMRVVDDSTVEFTILSKWSNNANIRATAKAEASYNAYMECRVYLPGALIGDTPYKSLDAAISAANDTDVITMLSDTTTASTKNISKGITIDLNGHTITGHTNSGKGYRVFNVKNSGNLTLIGEGFITTDPENYANFPATSSVINVEEGGKLVVGDKITVAAPASNGISVAGMAELNGTVGTTKEGCAAVTASGSVTIKGGAYSGEIKRDGSANISVTGGCFTNDPTAYVGEGLAALPGTYVVNGVTYNYKVAEKLPDNVAVVPGKTDVEAPASMTKDDADKIAESTAVGTSDKANEAAAKLNDADKATKDSLNAKLPEEATKATDGDTITTVVAPRLDIEVKSYDSTSKTLTLDIEVVYDIKATTNVSDMKENDGVNAASAVNTVTLKENAGTLDTTGTPVTVKLSLPAAFAAEGDTLYITHTKDSGAKYVFPVTVKSDNGSLYVEFVNDKGFSTFSVSKVVAASITANGTTTYYETLQDAVNAVQNGETITLAKDGEVATVGGRDVKFTVDPDGKNYTINLGIYCINKSSTANEYDIVYSAPTYVPCATGYVVNVVPATNGTVSASHKTAAAGTTVTVTVSPANGYELSGLTVTDARGNALTLTDLGNGKYSFVMPASKVDVTAAFAAKSAAGFRDIAADAYYAPAVVWAVEKGITNGVTADLYAPAEPCTRGQIVTFLWRAAGSPAPKTSVNPFTDVTSADYYYNAVLWAVENGVTEGTSDTTFSPGAVCTRAQAVTFLCRALKGSAGSAAAFTDVPADAYYAAAVNWAVANGVTKGTSDTTFSPDASCTRAEIVTFLYRAYQGK